MNQHVRFAVGCGHQDRTRGAFPSDDLDSQIARHPPESVDEGRLDLADSGVGERATPRHVSRWSGTERPHDHQVGAAFTSLCHGITQRLGGAQRFACADDDAARI